MFPSESNNSLSLFLWTPAAAKRIVNIRFLKFLVGKQNPGVCYLWQVCPVREQHSRVTRDC